MNRTLFVIIRSIKWIVPSALVLLIWYLFKAESFNNWDTLKKIFFYIFAGSGISWWLLLLYKRRQIMTAVFSLIFFSALLFISIFLPVKKTTSVEIPVHHSTAKVIVWFPRVIDENDSANMEIVVYGPINDSIADSTKLLTIQSYSHSNTILYSPYLEKEDTKQDLTTGCRTNSLYKGYLKRNSIERTTATLRCKGNTGLRYTLWNGCPYDTIKLHVRTFADPIRDSTGSHSGEKNCTDTSLVLRKSFPISHAFLNWSPYVALLSSILAILWAIADRIRLNPKNGL
jgi:hypothetical protein